MSDTIKVYFYGGHRDGDYAEFSQVPKQYDAPVKRGDRHPPKRAFTRYVRSDEWSQHLGKLIFIPEDFPGRPPKREHQTA